MNLDNLRKLKNMYPNDNESIEVWYQKLKNFDVKEVVSIINNGQYSCDNLQNIIQEMLFKYKGDEQKTMWLYGFDNVEDYTKWKDQIDEKKKRLGKF